MENFISCPEGDNKITFVLSEGEIEAIETCLQVGLRSGYNSVAEIFQKCMRDASAEFRRLRELRLSVPHPLDVNVTVPLDPFPYEDEEEYYDDEEEGEDY